MAKKKATKKKTVKKKTVSKKPVTKAKKSKTKSAGKKVENEKLVSVLAYFFFGILWYFIDDKMKRSALAKHHTKQAINLILASIIINIAGTIIPFLGWFVIFPVGTVILVILWIFGLVYSINAEKKDLPLIGKFARKYLTF